MQPPPGGVNVNQKLPPAVFFEALAALKRLASFSDRGIQHNILYNTIHYTVEYLARYTT